MFSLKAPEARAVDRQPVDIVAVVDRSGSMQGEAMAQLKRTLRLLVENGLSSDDKLSIVAFDNQVTTPLPLTQQTVAGREAALAAISKLEVGGQTNLSGGLLHGIDVLLSGCPDGGARTRAVLLLTDGHANQGICDGQGILAAVQGVLQGRSLTLFTFGLGSSHDEDLLRALAEPHNGLFYFLGTADSIPPAFADCLGGLISVVAQNATLRLKVQDGATLSHVFGKYHVDRVSGHHADVALGDVYGEDAMDVMASLELPALAAEVDAVAAGAL
eukprot:2849962-Prymnesium_polylepis.1